MGEEKKLGIAKNKFTPRGGVSSGKDEECGKEQTT